MQMNEHTFESLEVGHAETFTFTVSDADMRSFREITGDINPLHSDPQYAKSLGYDGCVVFGMLTSSFLSTLAGMYLPGRRSLIQSVQTDMVKPVYTDTELTMVGTVAEKNDTFRTIKIKYHVCDASGAKVLRGSMRVGVSE